jgi:5'-deoxynucleotidase
MIAYALAMMGKVRHGKDLDPSKAALIGLFHDASEIITGDMPTPVKYHDPRLRDAYKEVEREAEMSLLATLPDDLRPSFAELFEPDGTPEDAYLWRLVKAADKLSALITCLDEAQAGNTEFRTAEQATRAAVDAMAGEMPEVSDFLSDFLPAYGRTLDELL